VTISAVGAGASALASHTLVQDGSFSSIASEVAVLLLETQENQKQSEREQISMARAEFSDALEDEVEALKAEADAGFRGAMLQAGLTVAGAGLSLWGVGRELERATWQEKAGEGLDHMAKPLGEMASKTYARADAKSAEGVETAAKWQLDDARKALDDANASQTKALDWLGSIVDRDAATMSAILSNKV
jgi:hypothetical protein